MRAFVGFAGWFGGAIIWFFRTPRRAVITLAVMVIAIPIGMGSMHHDATQYDKRQARVEQQWFEKNKRESDRLAHQHYTVPKDCKTEVTKTYDGNGKLTGTKRKTQCN